MVGEQANGSLHTTEMKGLFLFLFGCQASSQAQPLLNKGEEEKGRKVEDELLVERRGRWPGGVEDGSLGVASERRGGAEVREVTARTGRKAAIAGDRPPQSGAYRRLVG
jgi:hypothetical protein